MANWFSRLQPGDQIWLVLMALGFVFNCGVYWATVRYLSRDVRGLKVKSAAHDQELKHHGERIATLEGIEGIEARTVQGKRSW